MLKPIIPLFIKKIHETLLREIILFSELIWEQPPSLQPIYVRVRKPGEPQ